MKIKLVFAFILLLTTNPVYSQWTQQGNDIDGEAADDYSGESVSLSSDGSRIAIGAYQNDGNNGQDSGHVRIYEFNGTAWSQLGQDIDGEAADDYSGRSVSLSDDGNRVAIGAYQNDGNGNQSGHVRIYEFDGTNWNQLGIDINGENAGDSSGWSVSLNADGNRIAIGAYGADASGSASGHVRIYQFNGVNWIQLGNNINGEAANDQSGWSVSLSANGNRVAIGAPYNDGNSGNISDDRGHVRIYEFDNDFMVWNQLGDDIDGEATDDFSGQSISLNSDGNRVAIGAHFNNGDGIGNGAGHVRIYEWQEVIPGDWSWIQIGSDIDGEGDSDYFGSSVSLNSDGNVLVAGAPFNEDNGFGSGHIRVFRFDNTNWNQVWNSIHGEANPNLFGQSVSISSNGSIVAAGAPSNSDSEVNAGHARVFLNSSYTLIPDPNFEQVLINQGIDSEAILDGQVLTADISSITTLDISTSNIADLTGIEDFTALQELYCYNNSLTNLDLSNNTNLTALYCDNNQLSNLDISNNLNLTTLWCQYNQLTDLTLNGAISLQELQCANNQLTNLDIISNTNLITLNCNTNLLNNLDVTASTNLETLVCQGNQLNNLNVSNNTNLNILWADQNPLLTCIQVANETDANAGIGIYTGWIKDEFTTYSEDCNSELNLWIQRGNDIDGEAIEDFSGFSVSISSDGNRVAIGALGNDEAGDSAGHVRIFEFSGGDWIQLGNNINGENAEDRFGAFVSLSNDGNRLAVGAHLNDNNGPNSGRVRVYEYDGADWNQLGQDIDGEATEDRSGRVSFNSDGSILAIGAANNDSSSGQDSGHVRIYRYNNGLNTWEQLGDDIDGEAENDLSGLAVSLNDEGTRIAIGASGNDGNGQDSGHVRIYNYNEGSNTWEQLGNDVNGELADDHFGYSVSLNSNGNRVAIGATGNDINGTDSGYVRVYQFNGLDWVQLGTNIYGEAADDASGGSISINSSGNRVAIGAPGNDDNGSDSGHVRIYEYDGVDWNQLGQDINGEAADDWSGWSISLNNNGNIVAIGAIYNDDGGNFSGHVRIFTDGTANSYTTIPDPSFEQALIDQGIDTEAALDGQVLTSDISNITTLEIGVLGISDLTGIENFTALQELHCYNNLLTHLNVSNNINLTTLYCDGNLLNNLDVSNNTNLTTLWCQYNQITNLTVNGATSLEELYFAGNQISNIDVSGLMSLQTLYCPDNLLTNLELSTINNLTELYCNNNPTLSCIEVDNEIDANAGVGIYTNWVKDDSANYSENCIPDPGPGLWTQVGDDMDGEVTQDWFGWPFGVSLNTIGNRIAIGAPRNDGDTGNLNDQRGHVRVLQYNVGTGIWEQLGTDIDGIASGDQFGSSVSLNDSGTILAIGAPYNDDNGNNAGQVRIYELNGTNWTPLPPANNIDGDNPDDQSGYSIDLNSNGTILAIGSPFNNTGHVRVFEYNGVAWVQRGLNIQGEANNDLFGRFVSLSDDGNRLAVGAPFNDGDTGNINDNRGHVRVYELQGGNWVQLGTDIDGETFGDWYGFSANLNNDGTILAIGAPFNDGNTGNINDDRGRVQIYEYDDIGLVWNQIGQNIDGEATGDRSGFVNLNNDGSRIAIGGDSNDGNGANSGHVRVYEFDDGISSWNQIGYDIDGEAAGDSSFAASLNGDGNMVAIGAYWNDGINGSDSGHVRVFTDSPLNFYTQIPDANFEVALAPYDDIPGDNQVPTTNISTLTTLNVGASGITDLTGIEDFTALQELYCYNNLLTTLDVSNNINLTTLYCDSNQLTNLDVSNNTNLATLWVQSNPLTDLTVNGAANLQELQCAANQLTTLDVSGLTNLQTLVCHANQLTSLDVSNNPMMTILYVVNNPTLSCIQVANAANADAGVGIYTNWTKDGTANYSEDCGMMARSTNISNTKDNEENTIETALSLVANDVVLYPNPVKDQLYIVLPVDSKLTAITIYNVKGEQVAKAKSTTISTTHIAAGVYFVKIQLLGGESITKKVIVSKE